MRGSDQSTPISTIIAYGAPGLVGGVIAGLLLSGCGQTAAPRSPEDQRAVQAAIHSLAAGDLIHRMNEQAKAEGGSSSSGDPKGEGALAGLPPRPPGLAIKPARSADPCPKVAKATNEGPADAKNQEAMVQFGECLRAMMGPYEAAQNAFTYLKIFERGLTEKPFSQMTDGEIVAVVEKGLKAPPEMVGFTAKEMPEKLKVRGRFADRDLDELVRLAQRRHKAMRAIEAQMFAAYDFHRDLIDRYSSVNSRWMLFKALRDTAGDTEGPQAGKLTGDKVASVLVNAHITVPTGLARFPVQFLHPYAIMAVLPDEGKDLTPLNPDAENPFGEVKTYLGMLGGTLEMVSEARQAYAGLREIDNPAPPARAAAAPGAVRVAFIDSGIDYLQYPDLGLFLAGPESSKDLADGDANPFMPALGEYAHGSGTTATLLTILSHYAPEVLAERKVDVAMWKTSTIREFLAGPAAGAVDWDSRYGLHDGLVTALRESAGDIPATGRAPQIVSVSMAFPIQKYLEQVKKPGLPAKAPWLWVMAAGNDGAEVGSKAAGLPTCLSDVPAAERPDARILCVGALSKGIVHDQVASYSNYGARVDVYAYDSYYSLCPNGTSCATPAVSSAAAAILAKHPSLTAEQLKATIVEASVEQTLPVQLDSLMGDDVVSLKTRTVRVFDAPTMLGRAMAIAARKAAPARPVVAFGAF